MHLISIEEFIDGFELKVLRNFILSLHCNFPRGQSIIVWLLINTVINVWKYTLLLIFYLSVSFCLKCSDSGFWVTDGELMIVKFNVEQLRFNIVWPTITIHWRVANRSLIIVQIMNISYVLFIYGISMNWSIITAII